MSLRSSGCAQVRAQEAPDAAGSPPVTLKKFTLRKKSAEEGGQSREFQTNGLIKLCLKPTLLLL